MFLQSKENSHQTEETAYKIVENLFQLYIWQEINNQNLQRAQKAISANSQQPNDWQMNWTNNSQRRNPNVQ
jgi:hypothetical protein